MPANYVLLEKITVGAAGVASVTFSGIPQTGYTDLVVVCSVRGTRAYQFDSAQIRFNGDTGNNYSYRDILGEGGGTPASGSNTSRGISDRLYLVNVMPAANATSNTFGSFNIYIPNYASSNYKSVNVDAVGENNSSTQGDVGNLLEVGLWSSTAAITSITVGAYSASMTQYSTFYLYGIAKLGTTPAIVPYATGGDTILTDGTYWYHTFLSSGTFTPQKAMSCDYLVVAGGGGGGGGMGGGGGAGGLRSTVTATGGGGSLETALTLDLDTAYTVTVGAGGASTGTYSSTSGSNSVFSTITSTGGGAGGGYGSNGNTGGSGGGGGATATAGGSGTANQGFAGFSAVGTGGGGGGGAGQAGNAGSSGKGGIGGNGVATSISGSSVTYGGGGGGGSTSGQTGADGGSGGGGRGADGNASNNTAGTANTGGGGGGGASGSSDRPGQSGGSGIVIVRYAI
jgi:hypothetical protein